MNPVIVRAERLSCEAADLKSNVEEASAFLKKLSNPDRLLVCCALADGERSVRELEDLLGIRQPGLSQQLAELREAGLDLVENARDVPPRPVQAVEGVATEAMNLVQLEQGAGVARQHDAAAARPEIADDAGGHGRPPRFRTRSGVVIAQPRRRRKDDRRDSGWGGSSGLLAVGRGLGRTSPSPS